MCGFGPILVGETNDLAVQRPFFFFFFLERKEKMKISNQSCCKMLLQGGCGCDCDADVMLRGIWNVRWDGAQVMRRMDMGMDMDGVSL